MRIDILSLFPEYFQGPFGVSMLKRAIECGAIDPRFVDIRQFAENKHNRVDDRPYGGGPGMVMTPGPSIRAIRSVKQEGSRVIFLSPRGETLRAKKCKELSTSSHLILLCGHYEGVDQRVIDTEVDEELSIGPYVLTNGCLPAIVLVDALIRFIPGVLGNEESPHRDSFQGGEGQEVEGPQYTRPEVFEGVQVPPVLLGGNHQEIEKWRKKQTKKVSLV